MITERTVPEPTTDSVVQVLGRLVDTMKTSSVFGQPIEYSDRIVIPCSNMSVNLGMGFGSGPVIQDSDQEKRRMGGGGGGGSAMGRPMAIIVMSKDGVSVQPIPDVTRIVVTALATAALTLMWFSRLMGGVQKKLPLIRLRKMLK